jgi:hypothetical protein
MGREIVIVGNGEIESGLSAAIDAADIVIRFNDCRSVGAGGARTDIVAVCNTGRPGKKMLHEPGWKDNLAVAAASSVWCVRDPEKFAALRAPLSITHPELDDFCDDYTAGFAAFAAETGKTFHVIPASTHAQLDNELAAFDPAPYVVPSSGLVAVAEFLSNFMQASDTVHLAGFGHQGWEWHPWEAERRWVDARIAAGDLARLTPFSSRRSASGA